MSQGSSDSPALDLALPDLAATQRLARALAANARPGDVIALHGDLGSGKTTFARAFINALPPDPTGTLQDREEEVPSPTFTLVQIYARRPAPVWHFDFYRIQRADEAYELGIEEAFSEGISVIEWPVRLGSLLPSDRLDLELEFAVTPDARPGALARPWPLGRARGGFCRPSSGGLRVSDRADRLDRFLTAAGWGEAERSVLAADASFRRYDRLRRDGECVVLMDAPPPQENLAAFHRVQCLLIELGFSAPRPLAVDLEQGFMLLEDLGDRTFTRALAEGAEEAALYRLAVDVLIALHERFRSLDGMETALPSYDDQRLLDEVLLFPDWYLLAIGRTPTDNERSAYLKAWRQALAAVRQVPETLVLRDYHVDNLMVLEGRAGPQGCGLLDFQDAVLGPVTYDLVSLLEDVRRDVSPDLVAELRARYLAAFPELDRAAFDAAYAVLGAQRNAKIIGIFTRLCRRDGKPQYLRHIPRTWRLLEADLTNPALSEVRDWFDRSIAPVDRRPPDPESP